MAKLKPRRASNVNKRLTRLKDTIQRLKKKLNKLELKCETEILALKKRQTEILADIESLKANEHKLIICEMLYFLEDKIFRILHPVIIQPDVHFKLRTF